MRTLVLLLLACPLFAAEAQTLPVKMARWPGEGPRPCDAQANAPKPAPAAARPVAVVKATERTLINGVWVVTREWTEPAYTPPVYPITPAAPVYVPPVYPITPIAPPYQPPVYPITPYYQAPTYRPAVSANFQFGGLSAGASYCPPGSRA